MILLDTDHLSIANDIRSSRYEALVARFAQVTDLIAIPVVGVEEQCKGWLAKIHRERDIHRQIATYERFIRFFTFFRTWEIVSFGKAAADLFVQHRKRRIRIGSQDLKIACIAVSADALLLSANLSDFRQVPGLRVENWLEP